MRLGRFLCCCVIPLSVVGCSGKQTEHVLGEQDVKAVCMDILVTDAESRLGAPIDDATRKYIETTYCDRFAAGGWILTDRSISIEAQRWLDAGEQQDCVSEQESVPCDEEAQPVQLISCSILRHVRRDAVRAYLTQRAPNGEVRCDDGTPTANLGVE